MLKARWFFVVVFFLLSSSVMASTPSKAQLERVEKLLEISQVDQIIDQQKKAVIDSITKDPKFAKHRAEIDNLFTEILNIESLKKEIAQMYCEYFTEDEINEMIAFNQSPLGQKILNKLPMINQSMTERAMSSIDKNQNKIQNLILKIALEEAKSNS